MCEEKRRAEVTEGEPKPCVYAYTQTKKKGKRNRNARHFQFCNHLT